MKPDSKSTSRHSVEPIRDVAEQAKAAGRDVQNAAVDFANTSAEALKGHASHAVEAAKDLASSAQDRLQDKVAEQKGIGRRLCEQFRGRDAPGRQSF